MRSLLLKRLKRGKQRFNTDCLLITKDVIICHQEREREFEREKYLCHLAKYREFPISLNNIQIVSLFEVCSLMQ